MSKKEIVYYVVGVMLALLVMSSLYVLSWLFTCGIIKLITLCLGVNFKWSVATGIWLIICLVQGIASRIEIKL